MSTAALAERAAAVDAAMRRVVDLLPPSPLAAMVRYHLGWADAEGRSANPPHGKRLRSALCLLSCEAAGGRPDDAIGTAAAIELIHDFSLVHDDVQDRSPERRFRPAVWALWGDGQAINVGDVIFSLAHLAPALTLDGADRAPIVLAVLRCLDRCCIDLVTGQTLDLHQQGQVDVTVERYLAMIDGKSAALIGAACEAGALIAGADEATISAYRSFGRTAGLAFQIVDDVLGIWGDQRATGKPQSDDVYKQKISLPVIVALEGAAPADRTRLAAIYRSRELSDRDVAEAIAIMDRAGTRRRVEETAQRYLREALAALGAGGATSRELRDLARRLVERVA